MTVEEYLILVTLLRKYRRMQLVGAKVDYADTIDAVIERVKAEGLITE